MSRINSSCRFTGNFLELVYELDAAAEAAAATANGVNDHATRLTETASGPRANDVEPEDIKPHLAQAVSSSAQLPPDPPARDPVYFPAPLNASTAETAEVEAIVEEFVQE